MEFDPAIVSKIFGIRAEASNNNLVPLSISLFMSNVNASGLAIVIPIPIAAECGVFGNIPRSLFVEPTVRRSAGIGRAIIFGE